MLRELISIFRAGDPLESMGQNFTKMLKITEEMTLAAGEVLFGGQADAEARTAIYKRDIKVNKLERKIRKQVAAHLAISQGDIPFSLLLMSLVKDVERIGDYATNIAEVSSFYSDTLPDDDIVTELNSIKAEVEGIFAQTSITFEQTDRETAIDLIRESRSVQGRCDALIIRIASSSYGAGLACATALGTRYYKRITGHLHNVLSSIVMPLHKLDYYDEKELQGL